MKLLPIYVLHPGTIRSINDSDTHFIGAGKLIRLFNVPRDRYIVYDYDRHHSTLDQECYIHIYPSEGGRYYDIQIREAKWRIENSPTG